MKDPPFVDPVTALIFFMGHQKKFVCHNFSRYLFYDDCGFIVKIFNLHNANDLKTII